MKYEVQRYNHGITVELEVEKKKVGWIEWDCERLGSDLHLCIGVSEIWKE